MWIAICCNIINTLWGISIQNQWPSNKTESTKSPTAVVMQSCIWLGWPYLIPIYLVKIHLPKFVLRALSTSAVDGSLHLMPPAQRLYLTLLSPQTSPNLLASLEKGCTYGVCSSRWVYVHSSFQSFETKLICFVHIDQTDGGNHDGIESSHCWAKSHQQN